jgi:hypothetical protein
LVGNLQAIRHVLSSIALPLFHLCQAT